MGIVENERMNIVCRLGGFHLLMSFLGSIGFLMGGSGLEVVLENVSAPNVIQHILSGKDFSKAVRSHMLTHTALLQLMLEEPLEESHISQRDLEKLSQFKPGDLLEDFKVEGTFILSAVTEWKKK